MQLKRWVILAIVIFVFWFLLWTVYVVKFIADTNDP